MAQTRKRTRTSTQYESDSDSDTPSNCIDTTEATHRAIGILLNDTRAGKATKHKVLSEKMGMKWPVCQQHINRVLGDKFGLEVKELPRLAEGPYRGEVILMSSLSSLGQSLVNKYSNPRNMQLAGKQRMIVLFVVVEGDECPDRVLDQRVMGLKMFKTSEEARACVQKMVSMRLLEAKKQNASGTDATIIYSTGAAAALLYDKETVIAQLKSIVGYDEDNQIAEIKQRNEEHIRDLVDRSFS